MSLPLDDQNSTPFVPADSMLALDLRTADAPPWSIWDVALVAFAFLFVLIVGFFVALGVAHSKHLAPDEVATDARFVVPVQLAAYAGTLALMWLMATISYRRRFGPAMQWHWPRGRNALVFFAGGVPLALALQWLQTRLPMPPAMPMEKYFRSPTDALLMGVLAVVAAPPMEELFFRGLLYPVLRRWGVAVGVVATSLAFALMHGSQYGWAWGAILVVFIVGLTLTLTRAVSSSVAASFLVHLGYNLTLFVLLYLTSDHFQHLERVR